MNSAYVINIDSSQQMATQEIISFAAFACVAAVTPGPSNVMLAAAGKNIGFLRGLPSLAGVALGMSLLIFLVAIGLGQLLLKSDIALVAMKIAGSLFLLWLSWKIATAGTTVENQTSQIFGFIPSALFQWINPKSWIVSASAVSTYLQPGNDSAIFSAFLLASLFFACAVPCLLLWLLLGRIFNRLFVNERASSIFNRVMAGFLVASIVLVYL